MQILRNLSETVFDNLCDSTDVSANLLTELKIHGIIGPELCGKIGAEFDPKSKAERLYNSLKKYRTNDDFPKLLDALRESGNTQAITILNQTAQEVRNPFSSMDQHRTFSQPEAVLFMSGNGGAISGLKIIGRNTGIIMDGSQNMIKRVEFSDTKDGIRITGDENTIDNVTMTNLEDTAIDIYSNGNNISNITGLDVKRGIGVDGSNNNFANIKFRKRTRGFNSTGVELCPGSSHNTISNLTCVGYSKDKSDMGLSSMSSSSNCSVLDSVCGPVWVSDSRNLKLTNVDCGEFIKVEGSEGVQLINCRGKVLKATNTVQVSNCQFEERFII